MKITSIFEKEEITVSFEVFPPKTTTNYEAVEKAALGVAALKPSYMSVTYGAGGSTRGYTIKIAEKIQKEQQVTTIAHLTCVGATKADIHAALGQMKEAGIENILALRGDRPKDFEGDPYVDYHHASELVETIREYGDFCVGGACYPEGHPDAATKKEDILNLKKKVDAGCEFLTTQMFFDNNIFYNFLYKARELSGCNVPERFKNIVDRFGDNPEAMKQAGIAYATDQIIDLIANGVNHIHVYSMNKPEVAKGIYDNLSAIIH